MDGNESVILYTTPDGAVRVRAIIRNETLWLTQLGMAELFEVDKSSISRHLKNIFASGELDEKVVVAKSATTTLHGAISGKTQSIDTNFYNLDAIIAVGYRVNSARATHFRIWATGVLHGKDPLRFVVVRGTPAPFRCTKDALAWARANGLIRKMSSEETGGKGIVSISGESIRETLNPRQREKSISDEIHFAALTKLRDLIRESIILDCHPDYPKNEAGVRIPGVSSNNGIDICIAYAAFMVLGVVYRVRLTLKRYAQTGTSKAYAYRVNEIEVLPGTLGGRIALATNPTGTTSICASILLNGVPEVNGAKKGR